MSKASAVLKRVLRARNAFTVTQRACLLIDRGNQLKAEKQHGAKLDREKREYGRRVKKNKKN